jgi:hypothetical protein
VAPRFGGGLEAAKTARKIHGTSSNKCFGMQNVCDVLILKRKPKKKYCWRGEEWCKVGHTHADRFNPADKYFRRVFDGFLY